MVMFAGANLTERLERPQLSVQRSPRTSVSLGNDRQHRVELGPSFIPNADVARNVRYPRRISLRTAKTGGTVKSLRAVIRRRYRPKPEVHGAVSMERAIDQRCATGQVQELLET
jgi:hypothetical protein